MKVISFGDSLFCKRENSFSIKINLLLVGSSDDGNKKFCNFFICFSADSCIEGFIT